MELPELYKTIRSEIDMNTHNFKMVLISVGKPKAHQKFLKKHKIDWPNIETVGNSSVFNAYGINAYPTFFLIGPDGKVLTRGHSRIDLKKYLD